MAIYMNFYDEYDRFEAREYTEKGLVKAVNIIILRELYKYVMSEKVEKFYKMIGISKKTAENIIHGYTENMQCCQSGGGSYIRKNRTPGDKWDYKAVAETLGMDEKVFSGERLLQINGSMMREIKTSMEEELSGGDLFPEEKEYLMSDKENHLSEYRVWNAIMCLSQYRENDLMNKMKLQMFKDLKQQVTEKIFNDEQIEKFYTYILKNKENIQ